MPFPDLPVKFNASFGSVPREVFSEKEDGSLEVKVIPCNKKLPSSSKFRIENMVKAKVNLKETKTNILGSGLDTESLSGAVDTINSTLNKTESQSKE